MTTRKQMLVALAGLATASVALAQTDSTRAYAAELVNDATVRSSYLANGNAGHEKGKFYMADANKENVLNIGGQIQFQFHLNSRDDDAGLDDNDNDLTTGFQTRRTKLELSGKVANKFGYKILGAFDRDGGSFELEDAFVSYDFGEGWEVMWGQFKVPFLREESVSSKYQLAGDRSITNEAFNQDRSQGIQLGYTAEQFRFMAALSDGARTVNTPFDSEAEADYAITARGEFMWSGNDWSRFSDFTSWRGNDFTGMAGAAVHWQDGGETVATTDAEFLGLTADVSVEGNGWNAFAAAIWQRAEVDGSDETDDFGVVVQGGIFVADQWELFGRYDIIIPDDDRAADVDNFSTITVGTNYYVIPNSHVARFTLDLQWFLDEQGNTGGIVPTSNGTGLLESGEDSQWDLRATFQLLF